MTILQVLLPGRFGAPKGAQTGSPPRSIGRSRRDGGQRAGIAGADYKSALLFLGGHCFRLVGEALHLSKNEAGTSAPSRLTLKNTAFPGGIIGRWSRVNNFRYYEYKAATPSDPSVAPDWDALPIRSSHAAQATFSDHPVGQPIHLHVRPVGKA